MDFRLKQTVIGVAVLFFVGTIAIYGYYQTRAIIAGPTITVLGLESGISTSSPLILVIGNVKYAKEITLQGRIIFVDLNGTFREQLLLQNGYNIIELAAKDLEGRVAKEMIEVVYTPLN